MSSRSKDSRSSIRVASLAARPRIGSVDFAGELAVANHQFVGAVLLESDLGGDRIGEQRKAARDQAGPGAVRAHGGDQFAAARRRRDALFQHLVDHADRQILQQRDALAQRRLEFDLAAHRAFGDGGDMRLQAGEIGQFVDALLADHGGIHVGQKKLLAPERDRLHDNVDRQVAARLLQAGFDRLDIVRAPDRLRREYRPPPRRTAIAPIRARGERPARRRRWCCRARDWRDCR